MPARRQVPHVTPAQRDALRLIRFDPKNAAPSLADVLEFLRLGLVAYSPQGRLRLTDAGYGASRVMAVEPLPLAAFSDHADDSGASPEPIGTLISSGCAMLDIDQPDGSTKSHSLTMGGMVLATLRGLRHPAPAPAPEFRGVVDAAVRS